MNLRIADFSRAGIDLDKGSPGLNQANQGFWASEPPDRNRGFTLVELLVLIACIVIFSAMLLPVLANTRLNSSAATCLKNLKQLSSACAMYAHDSRDILVSSQGLSSNPLGRVNWFAGAMDWSPGNPSNWDTNQDMVKSPLWMYVNRDPAVFRCPEDKSTVVVSGTARARVRSYSMSQVSGTGEWLDKSFNSSQTVWRTYAKGAEIMIPAKTWIFADEHPNSMNDGSLAVACTGAQPGDPDGVAQIIDFPASYHYDGASGFSFADGRSEIHRWIGTSIKRSINYGSNSGFTLNVSAGNSAADIKWLAANTTVKR